MVIQHQESPGSYCLVILLSTCHWPSQENKMKDVTDALLTMELETLLLLTCATLLGVSSIAFVTNISPLGFSKWHTGGGVKKSNIQYHLKLFVLVHMVILHLYRSCLLQNDHGTAAVDKNVNCSKDKTRGRITTVICREKTMVNIAVVGVIV